MLLNYYKQKLNYFSLILLTKTNKISLINHFNNNIKNWCLSYYFLILCL